MPADFYIDVNATGNNSGLSWSDAYPSIASGTYSAGNTVWISNSHWEGFNGGTTFDLNGTRTNPSRLISVLPSGDTDGIYNVGATIVVSGNGRWDDALMSVGIVASSDTDWQFNLNPNNRHHHSIDCKYTANRFQTSNGYWQDYIFEDCEFNFLTNAPIEINNESVYKFFRCTFPSAPADGHFNFVGASADLIVEDCDLSNEASIIETIGNKNRAWIRRCNLATSYTVIGDSVGQVGRVVVEQCSNGIISELPNTLNHVRDYFGNIDSDTVVYRSNGANDGTRNYSWKMVSNSNTKNGITSLVSEPISRWITGSGDSGTVPQTLTVYIGSSGVNLYKQHLWMEVHSPNESAPGSQTAQGRYEVSKPNQVVTGVALDVDSSGTWNGAGVDTQYQLTAELSPIESGPVTVTIHLSRPSTTIYLDPVIGLS